jgi:hypothetical protein
MSTAFTPLLFVKADCPHCFKLRLFLLESGLIDRFELRSFAPGDANEGPIRAELAQNMAKVTFPTVQVAPGRYQNESDDIIAFYANEAGIDPASLPLFVRFVEGILPRLQRLNRENKNMKTQLGI